MCSFIWSYGKVSSYIILAFFENQNDCAVAFAVALDLSKVN